MGQRTTENEDEKRQSWWKFPITDNRPRMNELRGEAEKSSQAAMNLHDSNADGTDKISNAANLRWNKVIRFIRVIRG